MACPIRFGRTLRSLYLLAQRPKLLLAHEAHTCDRWHLQIAGVRPYTLGMRDFRVSARGLICFCLLVVLLSAAITADRETGYGGVVWQILLWGVLLAGSLLLLARLWAARHDPDAARRIEAKGLYGLTPPNCETGSLATGTAAFSTGGPDRVEAQRQAMTYFLVFLVCIVALCLVFVGSRLVVRRNAAGPLSVSLKPLGRPHETRPEG